MLLPDAARQLQRSRADRLPARAQAALPGTPHHPGVGRAGWAQEPRDAAVSRECPGVADGRAVARLCPRIESGRAIKGRELANLCPVDILALRGPLRAGFARIRRRSTLAFGFLRHAGLSFRHVRYSISRDSLASTIVLRSKPGVLLKRPGAGPSVRVAVVFQTLWRTSKLRRLALTLCPRGWR